MATGADTVIATIAANTSISAGVPIGSSGIQSISIPSNFTAGPISFSASFDNGATYRDLVIDGNEVVIPAQPGQLIQINPALWLGVNMVCVRSGTLGSPASQTASVAISLNGAVALLAPSTSRRITLMTEGWLDTFPAFTSLDDAPITFDLSRLLAPVNSPYPAEQIASVSEFTLSVFGPADVSDTSPTSRIDSVASIQGSLITQRFGNWQADVPFIKYLVTAIVTTTAGNTKVCRAYLPVWQ